MKSIAELTAALQTVSEKISQLGNTPGSSGEELDSAIAEGERLEGELRAARAAGFASRMAMPAPIPALRRDGLRTQARRADEDEERAPGLVALSDRRLDRMIAALPHGGPRLRAAAGDVFQEGSGPDGGFTLPVDKRELQKLLASPTTIHHLCDTLYSTSNATEVPIDEDPDWSTEIAAADVAEDTDLVEDKHAFGLVTMTLTKSGALVRVTREMLEDVPGFGAKILEKLGSKLAWKLHAKCVSACLNSPAKVVVAETNSAGVLAPSFTDVTSVWGRMTAEMRARAVWVVNPAVEPFMYSWVVGTTPVYLPPGGAADAPFGRLFGRPVFFVEGLPAVGTTGDFALVDPMSFWQVLKTTGPRLEESIHAEFKKDVVQYRGYVRSVYKSKFSAPITRPDGTTAGNVVTIATRV